MRETRRAFIAGVAAAGLGASVPFRRGSAEASIKEYRLIAGPATTKLVRDDRPATVVWAYDGAVPGPELRVRQGERLRIVVQNRLGEATTVHWHGVRVPNAMDGVPGLTQPLIDPGQDFAYEFTPPDAGTFWYHPHADTLQQLGRGLAGALIVEEREPIAVDRDLLWFIEDWRLDEEGRIATGFGNRMEAGMSGRIGNTVTINGRLPDRVSVRPGERIRLRVVNAALARIAGLRFDGHQPTVLAYDGQPCDPHLLEDSRLMLGPAMRADLLLNMTGVPGQSYPVIDDFYRDLSDKLLDLAYEPGRPVAQQTDAPPKLPGNPLPEPDLSAAERREIVLQGGMMSGMGMSGMGMGGATWAINGMSMKGDGGPDMPPLFALNRGQTCVLALRNDTAWWHPMHLHGHSFRVVSRNGKANPIVEWRDTVLMPPRERAEIAFVADNPGDWMFHCHVTDHQAAGMMATLRIS
jgi:FtsP/CotA-like multicopper oxidase with cupredoxin domain